MKDLSPEQLAKAERLWQELLAETAVCRRLVDDLDTHQGRVRRISDELGELIPRPEPKLCSCTWSPLGTLRTVVDPSCATHGVKRAG